MKKLLPILMLVTLLAPFNSSFASDISNRLKGRILLQVESKGEAWYINPDNEKRYFLGRPADAFQVMRELGLGISNKDFDSFNEKAPKRLAGKILLKVEDSGKAYYASPTDLRLYFLGRPADAFKVMRELGLGIKNKDLDKVETSLKNEGQETAGMTEIKKDDNENFKENVILMHSKSSEDIKRFIESISIDIADLKDRKNKLASRVDYIKQNIYFTTLVHDTILFNQMLDLYVAEHEKEIKYIDNNLAYINSSVVSLENYRTEYNKIISSLLGSPDKIVTRAELVSTMELEKDISSPAIYKVKTNIYNALINHYKSVIYEEDQYAKSNIILKDSLTKMSDTTKVSYSYYQPLPQSDAGLTMRQQLLLNPIQCKINHDSIQTTVSCY